MKLEIKKYFFGALLLICYFSISNILESLSRLLISIFESKNNILTFHLIILVLLYSLSIFIFVQFFRKVKIKFDRLFNIVLLFSLVFKGIQFATNFISTEITNDVYFESSSGFFNNEQLIKAVFSVILFIVLSIFSFKSKTN